MAILTKMATYLWVKALSTSAIAVTFAAASAIAVAIAVLEQMRTSPLVAFRVVSLDAGHGRELRKSFHLGLLSPGITIRGLLFLRRRPSTSMDSLRHKNWSEDS